MGPLPPFKRRMFDIQGYENVTDEDFGAIAKWMIFPFFTCATISAIGLLFESMPMLTILAGIAALAAVSPVHPLDLIYNYGIRYITGTGKLLRRLGLNRVVCAIAAIWLVIAIVAHNAGMTMVYLLFGWSMVGIAYVMGTLDVCIPSYVIRSVTGFPQKRSVA